MDRPARGRRKRPSTRIEGKARTLQCTSPDGTHWTARLCPEWYDAEFEVHQPFELKPLSTRATEPDLRRWAQRMTSGLDPILDASSWRIERLDAGLDLSALRSGCVNFGAAGHGGVIGQREPNADRVRAWSKVGAPPPALAWYIRPLTAAVVIEGLDRMVAHRRLPVLVLSNGRWTDGPDVRAEALEALDRARQHPEMPEFERIMARPPAKNGGTGRSKVWEPEPRHLPEGSSVKSCFPLMAILLACGAAPKANRQKRTEGKNVATLQSELCARDGFGTKEVGQFAAIPTSALEEIVTSDFRTCRGAATVLAMRATPSGVTLLLNRVREHIAQRNTDAIVYELVTRGISALGYSDVARYGHDNIWLFQKLEAASDVNFWVSDRSKASYQQLTAAKAASLYSAMALAWSGSDRAHESIKRLLERDRQTLQRLQTFSEHSRTALLKRWRESAQFVRSEDR